MIDHAGLTDDTIVELGRDPETQVEAWRLEQLLNAGYPLGAAERIAARAEIDLHRACDLVAGGCHPELAAEILL